MTYSVDTLQRSARLVKAWGQAPLPSGQTLAEALTVQGVSWWDVAGPNLAAFYLPPYLAPGQGRSSLGRRLKPHFSRLKRSLLDLRPIPSATQGCQNWPAGPAFLFLGFSAYMYRDVLQPVCARLTQSGRVQPVAVYDGRAEPPGAPDARVSVWQHWTPEVAEQARQERVAFRAAVRQLLALKALPEIIRDGAKPLWPQVASLFDWLWGAYYPALLPQAAVARHILNRHRPALVVSPDVDDARTRIYCWLGRQLGIPALEIQFGMCGSEGVEWQFLLADRVAIWGDQARETLLQHGLPAERLSLTGSPRYDPLAAASPANALDVRRRFNLAAGDPLVLFASMHGWLSDRNKLAAVKQAIFRAASQVPGLTLLVKPHPGEHAAETQALARGCPNVVFADRREDIRQLIPACDAFVALGSTTMMDALIANKVVIWPALPDLVWWEDAYLESQATSVVRSEEALTRVFEQVARGAGPEILQALAPARQQFLQRWVFQADGQASARIETLAMRMAGLAL